MKLILISALAFSTLLAQAPAAQGPTVQATQEVDPAKALPPDAIVAVVNGRKLTADEVKKMVGTVPPQAQRAFANNPQQFMREYAWYMHLQDLAQKREIDKESPYKERLEFQRMLTLVQAMYDVATRDVLVSREEEKKHYDENKEKYSEAQAKLIYIPFSSDSGAAPPAGKKVLTEEEAKTKAESVVKQARSGSDFVKLVKENSEDVGSVAQNGDIGTGVRASTTHIPEPMRKAILALKVGEVSDPVRHENGYYVFRVESSGVLPYEKVREEIYKELKQAGFKNWQQKTQAESAIQFSNEEFFRNLAKEVQQPQQ
jgi:peptidyl-prolyl cis-trans isomerase C